MENLLVKGVPWEFNVLGGRQSPPRVTSARRQDQEESRASEPQREMRESCSEGSRPRRDLAREKELACASG